MIDHEKEIQKRANAAVIEAVTQIIEKKARSDYWMWYKIRIILTTAVVTTIFVLQLVLVLQAKP